MSVKKTILNLCERGYMDDKEIFCYSYANISFMSNYILFMKFSSMRQTNLPKFMILSINNDKLHILKASAFGKPKEYFTSIDIERMEYIGNFSKDFFDIYEFLVDFGQNQKVKFYIQGSYKKDKMLKVVNAIKQYNKGDKYE